MKVTIAFAALFASANAFSVVNNYVSVRGGFSSSAPLGMTAKKENKAEVDKSEKKITMEAKEEKKTKKDKVEEKVTLKTEEEKKTVEDETEEKVILKTKEEEKTKEDKIEEKVTMKTEDKEETKEEETEEEETKEEETKEEETKEEKNEEEETVEIKNEEEKTEEETEEKEVEGEKANSKNPKHLGWNSHQAVEKAPDSLVREGDGPEGNYPMRSKFEKMCREGQMAITKAIEEIDGEAKFREDAWVRATGGGGMSCVLTDGNVFEKAGVNLSVVYGTMPQEALQSATERGIDRAKGMAPGERVPFFACGLSCVMHPKNPHCPTMHFNYRYFETDGGIWWFGGGTDITPTYVNEDDMKHFHGTYKKICDNHDEDYYKEFKELADRYFYIKHRDETRGLGGIFFDDQNDRDPEIIFEFSKECLNKHRK